MERRVPDAYYDRGAPFFLFFLEFPQFGSSRPLPKTDLNEKTGLLRYRMKILKGLLLGTQR